MARNVRIRTPNLTETDMEVCRFHLSCAPWFVVDIGTGDWTPVERLYVNVDLLVKLDVVCLGFAGMDQKTC